MSSDIDLYDYHSIFGCWLFSLVRIVLRLWFYNSNFQTYNTQRLGMTIRALAAHSGSRLKYWAFTPLVPCRACDSVDVMGGCASKSTKAVHPIEVIPAEPGNPGTGGATPQATAGATDAGHPLEVPAVADATVANGETVGDVGTPRPKAKAKAKAKPTSLIKAIKVNDVNTVEEMLESPDCNLELLGMWDNTPLLAACMYGHSEVALKLIQRNANVLARNEHGATALHYSAVEGCLEVTQALLAVDGKSLVTLGSVWKIGVKSFCLFDGKKRGTVLFFKKKSGCRKDIYIYIHSIYTYTLFNMIFHKIQCSFWISCICWYLSPQKNAFWVHLIQEFRRSKSLQSSPWLLWRTNPSGSSRGEWFWRFCSPSATQRFLGIFGWSRFWGVVAGFDGETGGKFLRWKRRVPLTFFFGGVQFVILGILSHKNTSIFHHFSKIAKSL